MDKPEKPKSKWNELAASLGRDLSKLGEGVEKAYREASNSEAGKQIRQALADAGPQVKKAAQAVGPELKKVVDQVRPDVERAVDQIRPELQRLVDRARPLVKGALDDLSGRPKAPPTEEPADPEAPPNVSPDVVLGSDDDPDEPTLKDPPPDRRKGDGAGSKAGRKGAGGPAVGKTIGRKRPNRS